MIVSGPSRRACQVHGLSKIELIIIAAILGLGIMLLGWFELEYLLER
ncbi:hypothetical protein WG901_22960 [Novosphingobium sp. PS1R-30]|uniref:Uncharacterized protein n=1 Tax=Novosphingobium anseongense TaxID=3133436 RepID=A0ABU8S2F1_9SPHN